MSNYRNKKLDAFYIKRGMTGKIRLFFLVLRDPWLAVRVIEEFRAEHGEAEAKLCSHTEKLAERTSELADARMEITRLKEELLRLRHGQI